MLCCKIRTLNSGDSILRKFRACGMCVFPILKGKVAIWQDSPVFQAPDMYPKKTSEVSIADIHRFPPSIPATTRGFRLQKGSCLHGKSLVLIGEGWLWLVIILGLWPPPTQDASHHQDDYLKLTANAPEK